VNRRPQAGPTVRQRFADAVDALVERVKGDRSVLAATLCGSLSHDTVWAKSDVDLVFVTIDDTRGSQSEREGLSLYADGVNVHALLMPRATYRGVVEGAQRNSFMHSFLARGRLLYSHDPTIETLFDTLHAQGERDVAVQCFRSATHALATLYKAHKWFRTRRDLEYTSLWLLYTATPLAEIELMRAGQIVDREVLPRAAALNPGLFGAIYSDLLNEKKTVARVQAALDAADGYLLSQAPELFAPLIDHLRDVGEARSCTEIDDHFARHAGIEHASAACEYLADQGLLGKASVTARLTKRSTVDVQELAFFSI
jgi:hypothetical protein